MLVLEATPQPREVQSRVREHASNAHLRRRCRLHELREFDIYQAHRYIDFWPL
jgi:hypothetical protein